MFNIKNVFVDCSNVTALSFISLICVLLVIILSLRIILSVDNSEDKLEAKYFLNPEMYNETDRKLKYSNIINVYKEWYLLHNNGTTTR